MYQIQPSSPMMIETCRSTQAVSSPSTAAGLSYDSSRLSSARSPRMASPESSSLSSGSPASVFSAVPPGGSGRHVMRTSNPTLPSPAGSMSDLSLWEMPKLDIDLIDQMFVGRGGHTGSGVVPVVTQTSTPARQVCIAPALTVDSSHDMMNDSTEHDLSTVTDAI